MKFGVDVNKEELNKRALEIIKDNGHLIVDLTLEKWANKGQEVFKKVLLATITNVEFYIGIEFTESEEDCKIFYSNNEISKIFSLKIKGSLNSEIKNVICENGNHLYLIRNMECPGLYIKAPLTIDKKKNMKVIDLITKEITKDK